MIHATAVIDLGFGDSGKGTTVEWLCKTRNPSFVIRFNGGSQAAHNVHLECGYSHTFSQLGCGTFQGIPTYLTKYMGIDPLALRMEANSLDNFIGNKVLDGLYIHKEAMVITPYHRALNRYKESRRGKDRHGSCGVGHGEAVDMSIRMPELTLTYGDLNNKKIIFSKFKAIKEHMLKEYSGIEEYDAFSLIHVVDIIDQYVSIYDETITVDDVMESSILASPNNVWEGAQGLLLDENYGFHPNTTWSTTGSNNITSLYSYHGLFLGSYAELERVGVLRSHMTRHGVGVFVTEDEDCQQWVEDDDNGHNEWQQTFRAGHLDMVMLRYSRQLCAVDTFVLTHFDKLESDGDVKICHSYNGGYCDNIHPMQNLSQQEELTGMLMRATPDYTMIPVADLVDRISDELGGAKCIMVSVGKTLKNKIAM